MVTQTRKPPLGADSLIGGFFFKQRRIGLTGGIMKTFNTLSELIEEWEVNGACKECVSFNKSCNTLQEVFDNCPHDFRMWLLRKGYFQFADKCEWSKLSGWGWSRLLSKQPQFADKCEWSKLSGWDWSYLLSKQPQFAKYRNN